MRSSPRSSEKAKRPKRTTAPSALAPKRAGAPQNRADAQQQFARLEGLGEIVVDADLEAAHAIGGLGARGEHDDRHFGAQAQAGGEGEAVFAGHHHVEHDDVERQAFEEAPRLAGRGGDRHAMAVLAQIGGKQVAQPPVVVDHQHMGRVVLRRGMRRAQAFLRRPAPINSMTRSRSQASIIAMQERGRVFLAAWAEALHGAGKAPGLQLRELASQLFALLGGVELTMAAIERAGARVDEILGDQFLEHPVEALLGDLEDVEQRRDGQAGMSADEMQDPVMGAAETDRPPADDRRRRRNRDRRSRTAR